jgi:hypothetical protein
MGRKPPALARELLRNFPKRRARNARRRRKGAKGSPNGAVPDGSAPEVARTAGQDTLDGRDGARVGPQPRDGQEARSAAQPIADSQEHRAEEALDRAAEALDGAAE